MPAHIRFVNSSHDTENSSVVIFQTGLRERQPVAVAAYIIDNCGPGSSHVVPRDFGNNHTVRFGETELFSTPAFLLREPGVYSIAYSGEENNAFIKEAGGSEFALAVRNESKKTVYVTIERGSFALIDKHPLAVGETISVVSDPVIYAGIVPQGQRYAVEDIRILEQMTVFSLEEIAGADLVMRGDGKETPFVFALENIAGD